MHTEHTRPQPGNSTPTHLPTTARWHLRLLGQVRLYGPQQAEIRPPSRAAAALLARLALWPEREHGREELIDLLWPGVELGAGRNRLRQTLSTVKALLEPPGAATVILADRRSLRAAPHALGCDVLQFEQQLRLGEHGTAAALYRGELMPGFYDEWIHEERTRLAALAERLGPQQGRASAPPAPAPAVAAPTPVPAPPPPAASRHALPAYLTRYFGDAERLASLGRTVAEHRLVTLVGPGGLGKTRLAVELARSLRAAAQQPAQAAATTTPFSAPFDLVAFVPLATCRDIAAMAGALAQAFDLPSQGDTEGAEEAEDTRADAVIAVLAQRLAGRHALLVLDNLEQLLPAAAAPLARLLASSPTLHVLATSRRVLAVDGEREFVLPPLAAPPADAGPVALATNPAVALFVDRARATRADFHLSTRNTAAVCALVDVLGGLPLAIELAAARVRSLGVAEMLQRLDPASGPGQDRLALLARNGPRAGADPRHASMHEVIAWSWNLLPPPLQQMLAALTVFVGGFTAAAANAVVGQGSDISLLLDEAVQHSLLQAEPQPDDSRRLRMSEPVREFALQRLAEGDAAHLRQRHRDWWPQWVATHDPIPPLAALRAERANLVAALASAMADGVPEQALHIAVALRDAFREVPLPPSGVEPLRQALAACPPSALKGAALSVLAMQEFDGGQRDSAARHADEALALTASGTLARAHALQISAFITWTSRRDRDTVRRLLDEAEPLAEQHGDAALLASLLGNRAHALHQSLGDVASAERLFRRIVALWPLHHNRHVLHNGMYHLARATYEQGRLVDAIRGFSEVCELTRAEHDWTQLSMAADALASVHAARRDWLGSLPAYQEAAEVAWAGPVPYNWIFPLWNLPVPLVRCHQAEAAMRMMGFAAAYWAGHFGELSAEDLRHVELVRRLVRVRLGRGPAAALEQQGRLLSPPAAMQLLRDSIAAARQAAAPPEQVGPHGPRRAPG